MITRRVTMAGLLATPFAFSGPTDGQRTVRANNVVLVHGLYADGSCWLDVIEHLQSAGFNATAVQNPLTDLTAAVAETRRVIARQDGPTLLVGHSFAGTIISEAGDDPKIAALVYIAARAPDMGEDFGALAARFPTAPASTGIEYDGEIGMLSESAFLQDFANGVPRPRARALFAAQQPFHKPLTSARTGHAAWKGRPTFYAVSANDRTINPDLQRFMAKRMNATVVELPSGHLSMISHPDAVVDLIMRAGGRFERRLVTSADPTPPTLL